MLALINPHKITAWFNVACTLGIKMAEGIKMVKGEKTFMVKQGIS